MTKRTVFFWPIGQPGLKSKVHGRKWNYKAGGRINIFLFTLFLLTFECRICIYMSREASKETHMWTIEKGSIANRSIDDSWIIKKNMTNKYKN